MRPTIVFDFDGTIALGNGPITAFAHEIGRASGDPTFAARAERELELFEAGTSDYRDGYDAVTSTAVADGLTAEVTEAAYAASRARLAAGEIAITPPQGLADFLATLHTRADLVLATNAPGEGVLTTLAEWSLADAFDATHFTVGKPAGLERVLRDALTRGPVLSIGDIHEFDLAPAAALGADTALVGATAARSTAEVTLRAATLADLYDAILAWADAAASTPHD